MSTKTTFTKTLTAASANNIALSQSPGAAAFTLNGSAATAGVATIDVYNATTNSAPGRRVIITSSGDNSGISFIVTGTNASGNAVTDTFVGTAPGVAQSNLDFVTVTRVIGSAAVTGAVTVGTNGVGSSEWYTWNYRGNSPINIGYSIELVSGAVNYTVQYTHDVPYSVSTGAAVVCLALNSPVGAQSATSDSTFSTPVVATRILINSGSGVIKGRFMQAGIG